MRHRKSGRKLNRNAAHRKAMFKNLAVELLRHQTIKTTLARAKELRGVVEPLITKAKTDSIANRRYVFARLRNDEIVHKLFTQIGSYYNQRPGGYTRILKCSFRPGDKSKMAYMQLVGLSDIIEPVVDEDEDDIVDEVATTSTDEQKNSK